MQGLEASRNSSVTIAALKILLSVVRFCRGPFCLRCLFTSYQRPAYLLFNSIFCLLLQPRFARLISSLRAPKDEAVRIDSSIFEHQSDTRPAFTHLVSHGRVELIRFEFKRLALALWKAPEELGSSGAITPRSLFP